MTKLLPLAGIVVTLTACGPASDDARKTTTPATNNHTSGNPLTAPVDYLGAVSKGKRNSETTISLASTQKAIDLFVASEGRTPKNLAELVDQNYLDILPQVPVGKRIEYDAGKGTVSVVDTK